VAAGYGLADVLSLPVCAVYPLLRAASARQRKALADLALIIRGAQAEEKVFRNFYAELAGAQADNPRDPHRR
jgi:hypothetical protein